MRLRHGRSWRGWRCCRSDDAVLDEAASIGPAELRSLDALHLATALSIRDEIGVFVTYDERLGAAAASRGLPVSQPALIVALG